MKVLSNIPGPIGGEPLCCHEAALILIGHEQRRLPEGGAVGEGSRGQGLLLCLGVFPCSEGA